MAQFGKILNIFSGGIIPYSDNSVSDKTKKYWEDAKKYREAIKSLEAKGVTRKQLEDKGLIIPHLLEDNVRVSTMKGPIPGLPIIPILGTSGTNESGISNEVSDEEYNNLLSTMETIILVNRYIPSDNQEQAIRVLNELTGPEPTNTEERRRRRLILRGDVREIQIEDRIKTSPDEAEMLGSDPSELIAELEEDIQRTRNERNRYVSEVSPSMPSSLGLPEDVDPEILEYERVNREDIQREERQRRERNMRIEQPENIKEKQKKENYEKIKKQKEQEKELNRMRTQALGISEFDINEEDNPYASYEQGYQQQYQSQSPSYILSRSREKILEGFKLSEEQQKNLDYHDQSFEKPLYIEYINRIRKLQNIPLSTSSTLLQNEVMLTIKDFFSDYGVSQSIENLALIYKIRASSSFWGNIKLLFHIYSSLYENLKENNSLPERTRTEEDVIARISMNPPNTVYELATILKKIITDLYEKTKTNNPDLLDDIPNLNSALIIQQLPQQQQSQLNTNADRYLEALRSEASNELLNLSYQDKFRISKGVDENKASGINIYESIGQIQQNIQQIGQPYVTNPEIISRAERRLKIAKNIKVGWNMVAYKSQPKEQRNTITKTKVHSLLVFLSGPDSNNSSLYINYFPNTGRIKKKRPAGQFESNSRFVNKLLSDNSTNDTVQLILNVFNSYDINLNGLTNSQILIKIKNLNDNDQLDLYNTIALILRQRAETDNHRNRIILRNNLNDLTEYQIMKQSININRNILYQFQYDLLLTQEEIEEIKKRYFQSETSKSIIEDIIKYNAEFGQKLIEAQQINDIQQLNRIKDVIKNEMFVLLSKLFEATRKDFTNPYFNGIEILNFLNDLFKKKSEVKDAMGITLSNALQIPGVISSIINQSQLPAFEEPAPQSNRETPNIDNYNANSSVESIEVVGGIVPPTILNEMEQEARRIGNLLSNEENRGVVIVVGEQVPFLGGVSLHVGDPERIDEQMRRQQEVLNRRREQEQLAEDLNRRNRDEINIHQQEVREPIRQNIVRSPLFNILRSAFSGYGSIEPEYPQAEGDYQPIGEEPPRPPRRGVFQMSEQLRRLGNIRIQGRNWRRNVSIGGLIILFSFLGYGIKELVELVERTKGGKQYLQPDKPVKPVRPDKPDIPVIPKDEGDEEKPIKPDIPKKHDDIIDYAKNKAIDYASNYIDQILTQRPSYLNNFIKAYGNNRIIDISVCRKPIEKLNEAMLRAVTFGKLNDILKKYNYDAIFHLYMNFKLDNGLIYGIEKNEVIRIEKGGFKPNENSVCIPVKKVPNVDVKTFFENGERRGGKNFYRYDFRINNCQKFINDLLVGNGITNMSDFVMQRIDEILTDKKINKIGEKLVDAYALYNKATGKN